MEDETEEEDVVRRSCDGFGYDWSDQAEEGPTDFALMAYSSTSLNSSTNSEKNESIYEEDIKLLKCEVYLKDLDITELKRKLELVTKEKDEVQLTIQKFENSSKSLSELLDRQIMDKCKTGVGYKFEKPTVETNEPKNARKENGAPIIEDWVSESEEEDVPKIKTVRMHMTGNKSYLTDYGEIDGGFVSFGGNSKGGKITGKGRKPALSFMRPFGCPVTILNTIDHLDRMETIPGKDYILLPLSIQDLPFSSSSKDSPDAGFKPSREEEKKDAEDPGMKVISTEGKDSDVFKYKGANINQEKG
ncbi:hypothetical protein Tco_0605349 [Tanacetum coccineum]